MTAEAARAVGLESTRRLPLASVGREQVEAGSLMSYAGNFDDVFRQAADYADPILKGATPAGIAVEPPRRYEMIFNLRTARALGRAIPRSLLLQADRVCD